MNLEPRKQRVPAPPFRWRDSAGVYHRPEDMATRHLYYVIVMIWNHSMPEEARTHDYRRYRFGKEYTQEYMEMAVRMLFPVLVYRPDLADWQRLALKRMAEWLTRNVKSLRGPLLELADLHPTRQIAGPDTRPGS